MSRAYLFQLFLVADGRHVGSFSGVLHLLLGSMQLGLRCFARAFGRVAASLALCGLVFCRLKLFFLQARHMMTTQLLVTGWSQENLLQTRPSMAKRTDVSTYEP